MLVLRHKEKVRYNIKIVFEDQWKVDWHSDHVSMSLGIGFLAFSLKIIIIINDSRRWLLYLLIWDFLLSQINIWTTTTWSNVWVVLPKPSWYEFLIGFLIWTPASKYLHFTTFSNICVIYPCSYICNCLKCRKSPKLMNIVMMMIFSTHD